MRIEAQTASALRALAEEEPIDLVVSGDCMAPHLESGDRVGVTPRRVYLPGDIIAFRRDDDRLLMHRVLGYTLSRQGLRLVTQGDRLSREDEPVALECIVGRAVSLDGRRLESSTLMRSRSLLSFFRVLLRRSVRPWASAISS